MIKPIDPDPEELAPPAAADVCGATEEFFGENTPLRRAAEVGGRPYEPRPQQAVMAQHIAAAFVEKHHLCVEAPTGVGKTFAYLIPSILFARDKSAPVIVSTHTISLQEQIVSRDIPVLQKLLGMPFKAVLAKGRGNYVCLRRLDAASPHHQEYLPAAELLPELDRIGTWARLTDDGSRSALDFEPEPALWETINCEIGNCLGQQCPFFQRCFFFKARLKLLDATVIVANHALFFTDMAIKREADNGEGGLLPKFAAAVLDEGQSIEDTAAMHLGLRLTSFGLRRTLFRLFHPERNRGLLVDAACGRARMAVIRAEEAGERFFAGALEIAGQANANPFRYRQPGLIPDLLAEPLESARTEVALLANAEREPARRQELTALANQLQAFREGMYAFLNMTEPHSVHWLERHGAKGRFLSFNAVPVEVNSLLHEQLFGQDFTVVVTSATLAVRQSMEYFVRRIGAQGAETLLLDSPFNFQTQVKLYVPFTMPNPNDTANFVPAACGHIRKFLLQTEGHAFVLFTSYRMMQDMAAELADFFQRSGLRLLMQGEGLPRTRLLDTFRETPHAVLFGTDSFWTGVDVPGEALINVIIVKLPFSVPDHPLVQARQELIESRGGRAFEQYTLPEAILKFRQGFGRLIRSRDDHGIVVVLDNRIVHSHYGKAFLESLPVCQRLVF